MRRKRVWAFLASFAIAALAIGQAPVFGPEFQVNTTTASYQYACERLLRRCAVACEPEQCRQSVAGTDLIGTDRRGNAVGVRKKPE